MQKAADKLMEYPGMKVEKLLEPVIPTFSGEEALKSKKNWTIKNPIFHYAVYKLEPPDCDSREDAVVRRTTF